MAKNTKAIIFGTYLELVEKNEIEKISITELVDACRISRQTFYYHFNDISNMLEWAFITEAKKVSDIINNATSPEDIVSAIIAFLTKFESISKKSIKTTMYFDVTVLLYKSYYLISEAYLSKRLKNFNLSPHNFISASAYILTGLTIEETTKPEPNYRKMIYNLSTSLKAL